MTTSRSPLLSYATAGAGSRGLRRTKPPIEQCGCATRDRFQNAGAYCGTRPLELTDRDFEILHSSRNGLQVVTRDELLSPSVGLLRHAAHAHRGQFRLPASPQARARSPASHLHSQGVRRRVPAGHWTVSGPWALGSGLNSKAQAHSLQPWTFSAFLSPLEARVRESSPG